MKTKSESNSGACKTCGAVFPAGAPGGLCPACVLVGSQTNAPVSGVPSVDQIAAAFPELEIIGLVGRGGMGAVYHARQEKLDRDLALKILLPDLGSDPAFAERFAREARALAKLNHPNIVAVYDFGEQDGLFYLMMEFVDGVNLRQAMAAGRFTPEQAVAVIPGICDALQAAHGMEILHRDIKPENILLDKEGKVKIVDFGIARLVGDAESDYTLTEAGAMLGSRQYMAPEQLERREVIDHRADIYSLGVVFYEMLTGELPIGRFLPPSEKSPTTEEIDAVVMRALEKELDRRFQKVEDVKTEIREATATRPPSRPREATPVQVDEQRDIAGIGKITLGAVGMAYTGIVFAIFGFAINLPGYYGILAKALGFIGVLLVVFGQASSWLALKAINRREISNSGRGWLLLVTVGLPLLLLSAICALLLGRLFAGGGKGSIFGTMICSALPIYLVANGLVYWSGFKFRNPRAKAWMWRLVAVVMAGFGFVASLKDGRWPYDHSMIKGVIKLPESRTGPGQEELKRAADRWWEYYDLDWSSGERQLNVTVLHESRFMSPGSAHIKALGERLLNEMPPAETVNAAIEFDWEPVPLTYRLMAFGMGAALAAIGLSLLGGRGGLLGMTAMLGVYGLSIFIYPTGRLYPSPGPQLVHGPALLRGTSTELARTKLNKIVAITRAEAINMAMTALTKSMGRAAAVQAWENADYKQRKYMLLKPFLAFSPNLLEQFLPSGYGLVLPKSPEGKVVLIGPDGKEIGF